MIEKIMKQKWFLVEAVEKIVGIAGNPEMFYAAFISTSPHKLSPDAIKLAELVVYSGPATSMAQPFEKIVGEHLVALHNDFLVAEAKRRRAEEEALNGPKKHGGWPAGKPRGPRKKKVKAVQAESGGVVPQGHSVQAEDSQVQTVVLQENETQTVAE